MDRPRYVAFRIDQEAPVSRRAVGQALQAAAREAGLAEAPQLTRYAFPHGIVRVSHEHLATLRALLPRLRAPNGQAIPVETLLTSGTILALTSRLGVLGTRGAPEGEAPALPPGGGSQPRGPAPGRGALPASPEGHAVRTSTRQDPKPRP